MAGDPYTMMLQIGMTGFGLFEEFSGMSKTKKASDQYTDSQVRQINLEQKVEAQRQQAMELDAARRQKEVIRNVQRTRALGLAAATSSGSQFGSGLQGAYGQASGSGGTNLLGINQNLQIGKNIFGLNTQISGEKVNQAYAQKDLQEGKAQEQFGQSLINSAGPFSNLFGFGQEQQKKS